MGVGALSNICGRSPTQFIKKRSWLFSRILLNIEAIRFLNFLQECGLRKQTWNVKMHSLDKQK